MAVAMLTIRPNIDIVDLLYENHENDIENAVLIYSGSRLATLQLFAKQFFKR